LFACVLKVAPACLEHLDVKGFIVGFGSGILHGPAQGVNFAGQFLELVRRLDLVFQGLDQLVNVLVQLGSDNLAQFAFHQRAQLFRLARSSLTPCQASEGASPKAL